MADRNNSRLVYSTEKDNACPGCGRPAAGCVCDDRPVELKKDGVVRVRREVKGRAGKTVTTASGIPEAGARLDAVASELKRLCGAGGTVKGGVVVIQGDHRNTVKTFLEARGYRVKLAGG
jgi:translation initiation factor 1